MGKAPGHRTIPNHKVKEERLTQRMRVEIGGEVLADSDDVIRVDEDDHPPRYYFPREDVRMNQLERSATTSQCPFKGTAHYFNVKAGDTTLSDAVWTYEEPFDEHLALKERVAFYDDKLPEIHIQPAT